MPPSTQAAACGYYSAVWGKENPSAFVHTRTTRTARGNQRFFLLLGLAFFAGAGGVAAFLAGLGGVVFNGTAFGGAAAFPFASGFGGTAGVGAAAVAEAALPFFFPATAVGAAVSAAAAAAFAPRPRFAGGGGGGGGGGGARGFRNFRVSVRERSLPSSSSMKTSFAIFGYSGICGVM